MIIKLLCREASTSSREEDMGTCLCCNYIKDVKPKPLTNPSNEYQQFEITKKRCGFTAKSVSPDGFPPLFLRRKRWTLRYNTPHNYHLGEALGINASLRRKLPPFGHHHEEEPVVIGKWYCPFMFVKEEGVKVKDQMKRSVFYEMTLEQKWEKVFSKARRRRSRDDQHENIGDDDDDEVFVDVVVKSEVARMGLEGNDEAVWEEGKFGEDDEMMMMWFKRMEESEGERIRVGLSMEIVERMRWEEERGGWVGKNDDEKQVRFERVEKFEGNGGGKMWENFGFYVLVESFVLKRMDGTLVLTYDFRHTNHSKSKWE